MENGENWDGEHYFGYLDSISHQNDTTTGLFKRRKKYVERNEETLRNGKIVRWCRIIIVIEIIIYIIAKSITG